MDAIPLKLVAECCRRWDNGVDFSGDFRHPFSGRGVRFVSISMSGVACL
jgi:hypothetical protein